MTSSFVKSTSPTLAMRSRQQQLFSPKSNKLQSPFALRQPASFPDDDDADRCEVDRLALGSPRKPAAPPSSHLSPWSGGKKPRQQRLSDMWQTSPADVDDGQRSTDDAQSQHLSSQPEASSPPLFQALQSPWLNSDSTDKLRHSKLAPYSTDSSSSSSNALFSPLNTISPSSRTRSTPTMKRSRIEPLPSLAHTADFAELDDDESPRPDSARPLEPRDVFDGVCLQLTTQKDRQPFFVEVVQSSSHSALRFCYRRYDLPDRSRRYYGPAELLRHAGLVHYTADAAVCPLLLVRRVVVKPEKEFELIDSPPEHYYYYRIDRELPATNAAASTSPGRPVRTSPTTMLRQQKQTLLLVQKRSDLELHGERSTGSYFASNAFKLHRPLVSDSEQPRRPARRPPPAQLRIASVPSDHDSDDDQDEQGLSDSDELLDAPDCPLIDTIRRKKRGHNTFKRLRRQSAPLPQPDYDDDDIIALHPLSTKHSNHQSRRQTIITDSDPSPYLSSSSSSSSTNTAKQLSSKFDDNDVPGLSEFPDSLPQVPVYGEKNREPDAYTLDDGFTVSDGEVEYLDGQRGPTVDQLDESSLRRLCPAPDEESAFQIWVQYLISSVLDADFRSLLKREPDDYFLPATRLIENRLSGLLVSVLQSSAWETSFERDISQLPELDIVDDDVAVPGSHCQACGRTHESRGAKIRVFGCRYNPQRFYAVDHPDDVYEQLAEQETDGVFVIGRHCLKRVQAFHAAQHFKWHMVREIFRQLNKQLDSSPQPTTGTQLLERLLDDDKNLWIVRALSNYRALFNAKVLAQIAKDFT